MSCKKVRKKVLSEKEVFGTIWDDSDIEPEWSESIDSDCDTESESEIEGVHPVV